MLIEIAAGTVAGGIHALSGPDHLAALAPFAARRSSNAAGVGLRWGLGHALGVLVLGLSAWLMRDALPVERWSSQAEGLVGVVLIGIGIWALRAALRSHLHAHAHVHGAETHSHVHVHGPGQAHRPEGVHAHAHTHAAFGVGALHGVAGTAHLLGVLPALALPTQGAAIGYLIGYGCGAAGAMSAFGWLVGRVAGLRFFDGTIAYRSVLSGAGVLAIVVGGVWLTR